MWLFKRKPKKIKKDMTEEGIKELRSFRDIGQTFHYRNTEMIVEELYTFIPYMGYVPRIAAAYKNNLGEIKYLYFYRRHLPALIAENRSNQALQLTCDKTPQATEL